MMSQEAQANRHLNGIHAVAASKAWRKNGGGMRLWSSHDSSSPNRDATCTSHAARDYEASSTTARATQPSRTQTRPRPNSCGLHTPRTSPAASTGLGHRQTVMQEARHPQELDPECAVRVSSCAQSCRACSTQAIEPWRMRAALRITPPAVERYGQHNAVLRASAGCSVPECLDRTAIDRPLQ